MGVISVSDFQLLRRRFLTDVTRRQFQVLRMTGAHYQAAERLITKHGPGERIGPEALLPLIRKGLFRRMFADAAKHAAKIDDAEAVELQFCDRGASDGRQSQ